MSHHHFQILLFLSLSLASLTSKICWIFFLIFFCLHPFCFSRLICFSQNRDETEGRESHVDVHKSDLSNDFPIFAFLIWSPARPFLQHFVFAGTVFFFFPQETLV